jgi:hypothetical protein
MRSQLPEDVAAQELDAEFLDSSAGVFRLHDRMLRGSLRPARPGERFIVGWDPAKQTDYSAVVVVSYKLEVVHVERFRGRSYDEQLPHVEEIARRYNRATLAVDATGVGMPVVDFLQARAGGVRRDRKVSARGGMPTWGLNVVPVQWNYGSKLDMVNGLKLRIDRNRIAIPPEATELIEELRAYAYDVSDSGRVTYSAPVGMHDDLVSALLMANHLIDDEAVVQTDPILSRLIHEREQHVGIPGFPFAGTGDQIRSLEVESAILRRKRELGLLSEPEYAMRVRDELREIREPWDEFLRIRRG